MRVVGFGLIKVKFIVLGIGFRMVIWVGSFVWRTEVGGLESVFVICRIGRCVFLFLFLDGLVY